MLAARRAAQPLSSIPSNIQDDDLPMLDSQVTSPEKQSAEKPAAGRRAARRTAAAGGGGGDDEPQDSDEDMADAENAGNPAGGVSLLFRSLYSMSDHVPVL